MRLYCSVRLYWTVLEQLAGGAGAAVLFCATVRYCTRTVSWAEQVRLYCNVIAQLALVAGAAVLYCAAVLYYTVLAQLAG